MAYDEIADLILELTIINTNQEKTLAVANSLIGNR